MHRLILHLGSNLGDRAEWLREAIERIESAIGAVNQRSHVYETAAWGKTDQPDFLNLAVEVLTALSPAASLQQCQAIENALERQREERWGPRSLDIDLIAYDNRVVDTPELQIPHPRLQDRNFVLVPLLEIIPEWIHPTLGLSIEELYWQSEDPLEVIQLDIQL
jgi:2-amino-4-hydroxy-6-hydroxymethyldihydropteridine diphosphokinase